MNAILPGRNNIFLFFKTCNNKNNNGYKTHNNVYVCVYISFWTQILWLKVRISILRKSKMYEIKDTTTIFFLPDWWRVGEQCHLIFLVVRTENYYFWQLQIVQCADKVVFLCFTKIKNQRRSTMKIIEMIEIW